MSPTASKLPRPVVFLVGPTAVGKTAQACTLSEKFPFDLVSMDSALVYREMNIGTAKPTADELQRYPHRLIDLITPDKAYSAADFRRDAQAAIAQIHAQGRIPLVVGGTMMYLQALTTGLSDLPPADEAVRRSLAEDANRIGWPAMHARLQMIDPVTATRLPPTDTQRILRALEVHTLTGQTLSSLQLRSPSTAIDAWPHPTLMLGMAPADRSRLHVRIESRFGAMLRAGLLDELRALRERFDLHAQMPSMRCVGYRQAWQHLEGEIDQVSLHEHGVVASRQLAKRQLTWMRSTPNLIAIESESPQVADQLAAHVEGFLRPAD